MYQLLEAESMNAFTGSAYGDAFLTASMICGLGFVSICVGYAIGKGRAPSTMPLERISPFDELTWPSVRRALIIVVAVGFLLYSMYILQNGVGSFFTGINAGRSELSRRSVVAASGYLTSGLQFSTGALLMLILGFRLRANYTAGWLCLTVLIVAMYPEIAGGNRSVFIPILVALVLALYTTNPRVLSPLRVALGGPALFFLGIVAPRLWRDQLAQGGSLEASLIAAFNPSVAIEGFVGGLDTAMVDSFEVQLAAQQSGALEMQYGMTYVGAAGAAIPRDLWAGKPDSVDQVLNAALFPALDAQGIGFSFGFYSEPYFNFGVVGVLIVASMFGLFLGAITKASWVRRSPFTAFVFIMATAFIFPIMRGSLSFDIQRLLIAALPAMLVMFFALRVASRTKYSGGQPRKGS
ncbi:O-antigen polysaccharide polymerase Wzy [Microbacterium testaceum]|uniref:O-antigen polysaccharide polymerase Wzy n=1 Tax=Microbacterium testaceum TaxID=2033 RepID=UPI001D1719DB|nr:O-antigen polysaccharide polymerase Wzy [Microbacterium testaceum]MCC4249432.1 O-antigen polysaccharide polymerase Wzy family protein [Microbacterium testaceum]